MLLLKYNLENMAFYRNVLLLILTEISEFSFPDRLDMHH